MDCLGDSITYGYGLSGPTYPQNLVGLIYPAVVTNSGVNGSRTSAMVTKWTNELRAKGYDYVVVEGGVNDLVADVSLPSIEANLEYLWLDIVSSGGTPIAMTVLPWKGSAGWTQARQDATEILNDWIRVRAAELSVTLIDMYTILGGDGGDPAVMQSIYRQADMIHPNNAGAVRMAEEVAAEIAP